jgi:S-formylglutathione hydrolase FrmB
MDRTSFAWTRRTLPARRATGRAAVVLFALALPLAVPPGVAAQGAARVIDERRIDARVIELTVQTPAFVAPTKLHVNLPRGYDADPSRRWPVTYFAAGTQNRWNTFNDVLEGRKLADDYPSIIVSPDANSGYWSDWYNGGAFGPPKYETFVVDQLIPLIDARLRTVADRSQRAIFGLSMGGYGAAMLAARHPDVFAAASTISGSVDTNLPVNGFALSYSSTYDDAPVDAIYGPRDEQEVRWRGHNPTDLAANLRAVDLQVRTGNGSLNPGIGETLRDLPSCAVEKSVQEASISLHRRLDALKVPHVYRDYGPGCHSLGNFQREIVDTLAVFKRVLAAAPAVPATFDFRSIESSFDIFGWHIDADPGRAVEFLTVRAAGDSIALDGTGRAIVTTPPRYRGLEAVDVNGTLSAPDASGRVRFLVDLGPPHAVQQYTSGAPVDVRTGEVILRPHAVIRIVKVTRTRSGLRVCAQALGGEIRRARIVAAGRTARTALGARTTCVALRRARRARKVTVDGRDRFGHPARSSIAVRR